MTQANQYISILGIVDMSVTRRSQKGVTPGMTEGGTPSTDDSGPVTLSAISSLLNDKLDPIVASISSIKEELTLAVSSAKLAQTVATEAKSIASEAKAEASEANTTATSAISMATDAMTKATEATRVSSEMASKMKSLEAQLTRFYNNHSRDQEHNAKELTRLSEQHLRSESYSRRNNLKFDGVAETEGENTSQVMRQIISDMGLEAGNIQMIACHRYGPNVRNHNEHRPIVVKFLTYADRMSVWSNRTSLRGTNTFVKEDYPPEIEKRRKSLQPYLRAAYQGDPKTLMGKCLRS